MHHNTSTIINNISKINRLIYTSDYPNEMFSSLCHLMTQIIPFRFFAIAHLTDISHFEELYFSGEGNKNSWEDLFQEKKWPAAIIKSLKENKPTCLTKYAAGLPPNEIHFETEKLYINPIVLDKKVNGLILAVVPESFSAEIKIDDVLQDIGNDLAFAINFKLEKLNYQRLINEHPEGLLKLNSRLEIIFANKAFCEMAEVQWDDVVGKKALILAKNMLNSKNFKEVSKQVIELTRSKKIKLSLDYKDKKFEVTTRYHELPEEYIIHLKDVTESVNYLNELQESKEKYEFLAQSTFEGIIVHKRGVVKDVNEAFCHMTGYSKEEILGKNLMDYLDKKSKIIVAKQIIKKVAKPYLVTAIRKDGSTFAAEIEAKNVRHRNETIRIGAIRDVTERIQKDKQLSDAVYSLNQAQKIGNIGSWTFDFNTNQVIASDQARIIYGLQMDNKLSIAEVQKIPLPEYRSILDKALKELVERGKPYNIEFKIKNIETGKILDIHSIAVYNAQENKVNGILRDITGLRQREREILRFKKISDESLYGMAILTYEGKITYVNSYFAQIHGYISDELLGKNVSILHSKDQHQKSENHYKELLKKELLFINETSHLKKDGSEVPLSMNIVLIRDEFGKPDFIAITAFDISEQKEAKRKIIESEQRYQTLSDATFESIFLSEKGICVDQNKTAERMFGYTREEALGQPGTNWIVPEHRKLVIDKMLSGEEKPYEVMALRKDGSVFPCEIQGRLTTIDGKPFRITALRNITRRKNAEQELRKSEQKFRSLFYTTGTATVLIDEQGFIKMANNQCEELSGYSPQELENGMNWQHMAHPEDIPAFVEFYRKRQSGELTGTASYESRLIHQNGAIKYVMVSINNIPDSMQRIVSLVDISSIKKYEEELIQKNKMLQIQKEKAEESDRLKSAFLANMSHEIRTPMNGILGFTNLLQDPDMSLKERDEFIEIIKKSGMRMLDTVNDIIDISMIDSGNVKLDLREIDVAQLLNEVFEFFTKEAQAKGIQFILNIRDEEMMLHSDATKLNSIFTNLIKNALKFTPKGKIEMTAGWLDNQFLYKIVDTGIGISKDKQAAIFDRFIQADNSSTRLFEGSGLGLAITKSYVEMLGGRISLKSIESEGTTVQIVLPKKFDLPTNKN